MDDISPISTIHQKYAPDTAHLERYFIAGFGVYYTPKLTSVLVVHLLWWGNGLFPSLRVTL